MELFSGPIDLKKAKKKKDFNESFLVLYHFQLVATHLTLHLQPQCKVQSQPSCHCPPQHHSPTDARSGRSNLLIKSAQGGLELLEKRAAILETRVFAAALRPVSSRCSQPLCPALPPLASPAASALMSGVGTPNFLQAIKTK